MPIISRRGRGGKIIVSKTSGTKSSGGGPFGASAAERLCSGGKLWKKGKDGKRKASNGLECEPGSSKATRRGYVYKSTIESSKKKAKAGLNDFVNGLADYFRKSKKRKSSKRKSK